MRKLFTFCTALLVAVGLFAYNPGEVITLDLANPTKPTSFTFNEKNYWTETYNDSDYFYWESQVFRLSHIIDSTSWGGTYYDGFTVSKNADSSRQTNWVANQWGCMAGGGIATENETHEVTVSAAVPYVIDFWNSFSPSKTLDVLFNDGKTYEALGMYVCNHPWMYYVQADSAALSSMSNGDKVKLIAHGVDTCNNETTTEFVLSEFKDGALVQETAWQWFDLSSLGEVKEIYFTMESWDVGAWGINTPTYFCMDKLKVRVPQSSNLKMVGSEVLKVFCHRDCIEVVGASQPIELYTIQGVRLLSTTENRIATSHLPSGVYIVKSGNQSVKIVK